jgi:hypothetical protein
MDYYLLFLIGLLIGLGTGFYLGVQEAVACPCIAPV